MQPDGAGHGPASAGHTGSPFIVVARSRTEQLRFLGPIQTAIGVTAVLTMLLATVLSYAVARTVTRPLGAITSVMREVAATGDLTRKIPVQPGSWEDEDARLLASTFNTLTDSIARFEREASQRERLSSLGRLSSVVAHEIRNPLMIIKSAARTLRQPGAAADARDEALQDIEQEVVRLNRIVSEVLDYAKPITFAWRESDANAICREAAAAVRAADAGAAIETELAPGLAPVRTDPERVRTVLINVLQNAAQAVRGAGSPTGDTKAAALPPIVLRTCRAGRRRRHHPRARRWSRHRAGGRVQAVRAVLHDPPRRHRPRSGHREEHHRRARRNDYDRGRGTCRHRRAHLAAAGAPAGHVTRRAHDTGNERHGGNRDDSDRG